MGNKKSQRKKRKSQVKKSVYKKSPQAKAVSRKKKIPSSSRTAKKKTCRSPDTSQLKIRLKYEKALAACAHELLVNPESSSHPLQKSITHLLKAAEVSRVYIFETFHDPEDGLCVRQICEAVAKGIKPEIDNPDLQHVPLVAAGFARWGKLLPKGKHIGGRVSKFQKSERELLEAQDILSIMVLPIFVDHHWYGFIGFDDCVHLRDWSEDDIRMLRTASEIMGGYLSQKNMESILRNTQARLEVELKNQRDRLKEAHQDLSQEVVKRKRSIEALEESEERFRQLTETIDEIFWMTSPDGKEIIYVSPVFEKIFGLKPKTLYEDPAAWIPHLHPEDRDRVLEVFTEENLIKGLFDVSYRIIRPDGSLRWISAKGFPVRNSKGEVYRIAGIASDITKQKNMESQLMESEERFRSLVDQSTDPLFVHDFEGNIIEVNPKACQSLGYTRNELLKLSVKDIEVHFNPEEIMEGLQQLKPRESVTFEGVHRRRNGSTFPVEVHLGPISWKGEQYLFATVRDITQRKRVEQELLKTKEAAEEASRAKSEFLSRVSHELRTPLNAILGFGQLLESYSNQPLSKLQHSQVREILNAGRHLLDLINDVLDLSNIESGRLALKMENLHLKYLMEETLGLVENMARDRKISINNDLSSLNDVYVMGDRTRLKQVFLNLFTNALKYNREKGSVHIGVSRIDKNRIQVFIEDTGLGIPSDQQEAIFEPFKRLEAGPSPIEGTGMGLSIVSSLLEMMDGSIHVKSDGQTGSRFVITLSRQQEIRPEIPETVPPPKSRTARYQGEQTHRILYIEDNPSNLMLVQQTLHNRPNLEFLSSDHPREGIQLARQKQPSLILLDINLPEIDGYSVFKFLKGYEETRDIPVVAISAHAMQEDINKALEMGFHNYLSKPIEVGALLKLIDSLLTSKQ